MSDINNVNNGLFPQDYKHPVPYGFIYGGFFFLMRLFALFSFGFVFWLLVIIFQIYIQFKTYIKLVISSSVQRWLYDKRKVWWSPIRKR